MRRRHLPVTQGGHASNNAELQPFFFKEVKQILSFVVVLRGSFMHKAVSMFISAGKLDERNCRLWNIPGNITFMPLRSLLLRLD